MAAELGFDYEHALKDNPKFKKEDLNLLRTWITTQDKYPTIPKDMTDQQLLLFYNAGVMVIDDVKKCIKEYYSIRNDTPEHFDNRDCELEIMKKNLQTLEYYILPGKTDEGYSVLFHRLHEFEPDKYDSNEAMRLLYMTIDAHVYHKGPQPGFIFLYDMKGVKIGHITKTPIMGVAKFCKYVTEAIPVNMVAVHILNTNSYIDKIMFLLRPFLSKEILKAIHMHPENMDMEKFYSEHIPKRMLPPEYGGESEDTQTLHKRNTEILKAMKPYFDAEQKHRRMFTKKKQKIEKSFGDLNID